MLQIVGAVAALFAALTLLVASYRVGHTLFVRVSALVSIALALVVGTLVFQALRPPLLADTANISVAVERAHRLEVGYRVEFRASNQGAENTRQLAFTVHLLACPPASEADACIHWGSRQLDIPLHVPPTGDYPFARVLEYPPLPEQHTPAWRVQVDRVELYR